MQFQKFNESILIIDFGSQVTKLIARRIRDLGVHSEVVTPKEVEKIKDYSEVKGIIFSGGPASVTKSKYQSIPWERLDSATLRKPAILAPATQFPEKPYFSAVSKVFLWILIIIPSI